jgi:pyridinium-3,5-biscarboxylic acid mononucleotide sulfurtransferase
VDEFEDGLRTLGFSPVRVRFHDKVARVEIATSQFAMACADPTRAAIARLGKQKGFTFVSLDLDGFRSGSLNEALPQPLLQLGKRTADHA